MDLRWRTNYCRNMIWRTSELEKTDIPLWKLLHWNNKHMKRACVYEKKISIQGCSKPVRGNRWIQLHMDYKSHDISSIWKIWWILNNLDLILVVLAIANLCLLKKKQISEQRCTVIVPRIIPYRCQYKYVTIYSCKKD